MRAHPVAGAIAERAAHRDATPESVVIPGNELQFALELVAGHRALHVDQPAERIGAVARALRAAQHLDAVDVP